MPLPPPTHPHGQVPYSNSDLSPPLEPRIDRLRGGRRGEKKASAFRRIWASGAATASTSTKARTWIPAGSSRNGKSRPQLCVVAGQAPARHEICTHVHFFFFGKVR